MVGLVFTKLTFDIIEDSKTSNSSGTLILVLDCHQYLYFKLWLKLEVLQYIEIIQGKLYFSAYCNGGIQNSLFVSFRLRQGKGGMQRMWNYNDA